LPLGIQVASQLLGSTSLSALMAGPSGSGTGRAGSALNGAIALPTARTSPAAKPSLTVHIDDDSSDEEADRGIRMLSGTSSSSGLQWAAGRATVGEQTPPASRLSRPTVKPTLAGGSGPSAAPSGVSFASGRRAISAQTVLREEATTAATAVGSGAPQLRASADTLAAEGGITSQRCGGAHPALSLGRGGPSSGTALIVGSAASGNPSLLGASPPYPRAVYSQRTQSGPARMCEDAVLSGMVDVPGTPTSAKHGRRWGSAMPYCRTDDLSRVGHSRVESRRTVPLNSDSNPALNLTLVGTPHLAGLWWPWRWRGGTSRRRSARPSLSSRRTSPPSRHRGGLRRRRGRGRRAGGTVAAHR